MMLMLPHLIDDLEGRMPRSVLQYLPGTSEKEIKIFLKAVKQAECFYFGEIPLEEHPTELLHGRPTWVQPEVTRAEQEAWEQNLIPLPAPICWYEFKLGGCRTGYLLVGGDPSDMQITRVDYDRGERGVFFGIWVFAEWENGVFKAIARGNDTQLRHLKNIQKNLNLAADYYLAVYLTLMLCSQTTEIKREVAPPKLNKARIKRGDYPLPDHRVVSIVPDRWKEKGPHQGGTHRSPVLHWRRSHKRHFEKEPIQGRAVWMPEEKWRGKEGWWVTLIPRYLVGVADPNREYSHEYRVVLPDKEANDA